MENFLYRKLNSLKKIISDFKSVLVAYSGGVDSTFLLKVCKDVLNNNVLAVIAISPAYSEDEIKFARRMAKIIGVKYLLIETDELKNKDFCKNTPFRCYYCKKELFSKLKKIAEENNIEYVIEGTNYDDLKDFRPGLNAIKELGIRSPLLEAKLRKKEIRELSKYFSLPTYDKPSYACLSSRFPYYEEITEDKLKMIDEAERFLKRCGFSQVRVRYYKNICRIEVEKKELNLFLEENFRKKIVKKFKDLGFIYITLDLEGYRSGSMNEELRKEGENL
jgi:uncharacterized protein